MYSQLQVAIVDLQHDHDVDVRDGEGDQSKHEEDPYKRLDADSMAGDDYALRQDEPPPGTGHHLKASKFRPCEQTDGWFSVGEWDGEQDEMVSSTVITWMWE